MDKLEEQKVAEQLSFYIHRIDSLMTDNRKLHEKIKELENDYMAIQTQLQVAQFLKNKRKKPQRRGRKAVFNF